MQLFDVSQIHDKLEPQVGSAKRYQGLFAEGAFGYLVRDHPRNIINGQKP